jgi:hypothetical protein
MTDFQDHLPGDRYSDDGLADRAALARRAQARVEVAKAPGNGGGLDPEMMSFGLKLAFGVALFQLSLMATLFGHYTRG